MQPHRDKDSNNPNPNLTPPFTCLVTIHGIGFQQPPQPGKDGSPSIDGYADKLHAHLRRYLGHLLSDDPGRQPFQGSVQDRASLPVYVQSSYPFGESGVRTIEEGMRRLGTWSISNPNEIDTADAPLIKGDASIAHVALVYSALEGKDTQVVPSFNTVFMALAALLRGKYDNIFHLLQRLYLFARPPGQSKRETMGAGQEHVAGEPSGLRVRQDGAVQTVFDRRRRSWRRRHRSAPPDTSAMVVKQLQNDVAMYICANNVREQIRSFVLEALQRLTSRSDISNIVINAHSNGTVVILDALRALPPNRARKIKVLVTAGSPLRKYATLFSWGQSLDMPHPALLWKNFWDAYDFVADPLVPSIDWRRDREPTPAQLKDGSLYCTIDPETGEQRPLTVEDIFVNNVAAIHHGQGLLAHNYWDNQQEFIPRLADYLLLP
jgi:hypothetical protein